MDTVPNPPSQSNKRGLKTWFKRVGVAGVAFFTLKGLLWLLVPAGLFLWDGCTSAG
jgi:hypothetical protein